MSFLRENCTQYAVTDKNALVGFSCGDKDLDEFYDLMRTAEEYM